MFSFSGIFQKYGSDALLLLTLDEKGIASALILAVLILYFGGSERLFFLSLLILFLVLSTIVTNTGKKKKREEGLYEKSRGWKNVVANGLVPLFIVVLFYLAQKPFEEILVFGYIASIAAITADKFASEIGVLDGTPIMLLTLKRIKKGASGGVTPLGLAASFVAALLIALTSFTISLNPIAFLIVLFSGYMGNIIDSILGYYEEKGFGNKFTTNLACALSGFVISFILLALAGI